jgi:hypothetical protein
LRLCDFARLCDSDPTPSPPEPATPAQNPNLRYTGPMRGRVTLVVLLLLSFSFPLFPQCDQSLRYSGQFRSTAFDVALDGGMLWVATGYGVTLLEETPGGVPRVLDAIALPGSTRVVRADGQGVAYAGSGSTLHVLRRDGGKIQLVRSAEASGTVNDIALSTYLFVATSNGIDHFSIFDREHPVKTNVSLFTTSPNVSSLAIAHSTLYATDGDESVEIYSISTPSLPQRTGTLEAMPLAAYVSASPSGLIFVSDRFGLNTDVFSATTRLARYPFGVTSVASLSGQVHFAGSLDRRLRALDFSVPARLATLFDDRLAPTGGSENSIRAVRRSGDRLYVAAGDIGLTLYDISAISRPYPFVSYHGSAATSVKVQGDRAWLTDAEGRISEQKIDPTGLSLQEQRGWSGGTSARVHDVAGDLLLSSSGTTATLWSLSATPPATVLSASFPDIVAEAVIHDGGIVARLAGGAVWRANPAPQPVALAPMAHLARSGSSLALAEIRSGGTTTLHYYPTGNLASEAQRFNFDGVATGGIALDAGRAAVFTFTGISVADLATGDVRVISGSNRAIPRQLLFSGDDLLVLTPSGLHVYAEARIFEREHALSLDPIAIDASPSIAVITAAEGPAAISYTAQLPRAFVPFRNRYYTKVVSAGNTLYLFSRDSVEAYGLVADAPHFITHIDAAGVIDVAATAHALLTLSANGTITSWSRAGVKLAETKLTGETTQPLSITTVGNAAWVSVSKGCTGGICEKETIVLDATSLVTTSTMTGGIDDVAVAGNRAFALVSLPDHLRLLDVSDPLHPLIMIERPRPPLAASLAHENGTVHVLGERLYSFTATTLSPAGERLNPPVAPGPRLIRIAGNCAVVMRAGEQTRIYNLPIWTTAQNPMPLPSSLRSIAIHDEKFFLLTDHSLEVWSSTVSDPPARRRAVR